MFRVSGSCWDFFGLRKRRRVSMKIYEQQEDHSISKAYSLSFLKIIFNGKIQI